VVAVSPSIENRVLDRPAGELDLGEPLDVDVGSEWHSFGQERPPDRGPVEVDTHERPPPQGVIEHLGQIRREHARPLEPLELGEEDVHQRVPHPTRREQRLALVEEKERVLEARLAEERGHEGAAVLVGEEPRGIDVHHALAAARCNGVRAQRLARPRRAVEEEYRPAPVGDGLVEPPGDAGLEHALVPVDGGEDPAKALVGEHHAVEGRARLLEADEVGELVPEAGVAEHERERAAAELDLGREQILRNRSATEAHLDEVAGEEAPARSEGAALRDALVGGELGECKRHVHGERLLSLTFELRVEALEASRDAGSGGEDEHRALEVVEAVRADQAVEAELGAGAPLPPQLRVEDGSEPALAGPDGGDALLEHVRVETLVVDVEARAAEGAVLGGGVAPSLQADALATGGDPGELVLEVGEVRRPWRRGFGLHLVIDVVVVLLADHGVSSVAAAKPTSTNVLPRGFSTIGRQGTPCSLA
jgi:hypothetical protein